MYTVDILKNMREVFSKAEYETYENGGELYSIITGKSLRRTRSKIASSRPHDYLVNNWNTLAEIIRKEIVQSTFHVVHPI